MGKLLIGWSEQSIVPNKKIYLAGQFYDRISDEVESEITVTAMAVEKDGENMILVSADLGHTNSSILNLARKKIAAITDEIDVNKVIIGAIHTHTSIKYVPSMIDDSILSEFMSNPNKSNEPVKTPDDVMDAEEALEFITDKIATAVTEAWKNRSEALYSTGFGRAAVGHCRRVCYDDGSALMWGDTNSANFTHLEGGNDSGIELMYIFDTNKKLTGIVANVVCPAQVLEHRSVISADYWGKVKKFLREKFGDDLFVLPLIGAAGDQCPRDLVRWVNPETPINDPNITRDHYIERKADPSMFDIKGCTLVGKRVANEIISVYEELEEPTDEAVFCHKVIHDELPLRKATKEEHDHAVREIEYFVQQNKNKECFDFRDNAKMYVYSGTIRRFRYQQFTETLPIEFHVIRFGNIAIATNPFELFLDYGNRIKARSYAQQTMIMQLSCGAYGYLPTEKAEKGSHYSAYISSGFVGHEGGDILVRKTIDTINGMFK